MSNATQNADTTQENSTEANGGVTWFARLVENKYGIGNYEGPFSDFGELHAAEWGFRAGLVAAIASESTALAGVVGTLSVVKAGKDTASGGRPAFVKRNGSYAVFFAFLGYLVGLGGFSATRFLPAGMI